MLLVPSTTPHCRSGETLSESSHGGSASISVTANPFAVAPTAELQRLADVAARTAVVAIPQDVNATAAAILSPFRAAAARAVYAVWIGTRADVSARTAVVGIGIQDAAHAVALHRALDASIVTAACDALAEFKGTRVGAAEAATAAVVEVVFQVGAISPAARLAEVAAIVAAGSAVRVGMQIAACAMASRRGTTGVIATCAA